MWAEAVVDLDPVGLRFRLSRRAADQVVQAHTRHLPQPRQHLQWRLPRPTLIMAVPIAIDAQKTSKTGLAERTGKANLCAMAGAQLLQTQHKGGGDRARWCRAADRGHDRTVAVPRGSDSYSVGVPTLIAPHVQVEPAGSSSASQVRRGMMPCSGVPQIGGITSSIPATRNR